MAETPGSASARRSSYAGSTNVPRRLSYASVVTGTSSNTPSNPTRAGALAQNIAAHSSNNSYAPQYPSEPKSLGKDTEMFSASNEHRRALSSSSFNRHGSNSIPPFWIPSYLENTRYARKLEEVYNARVRTLRELNATSLAASGSIWNRSNNARIAPSHRGMTYEVIESNVPPEDDIIPLPQRLNSSDKHQGLDLLGEGLEVRYNGAPGKDLEAASVRSDYPISPQCGIYYYEINIQHKSKDCAVAIGFSTSEFSLERLPGWEPNSWAYHGDDGKAFEGTSSGHPYKTGFGVNDVVGCGIDFNKGHAFFTKNGQDLGIFCEEGMPFIEVNTTANDIIDFNKGHAFFTKNGQDLGIAFRDIKFSSNVYPCIGMKKHTGVHISVNLGKYPFVFDMKNHMAEEEDHVARQIARTSTSKIHRNHPTEAAFTQELIAQFLSHGGYIETARAFTQQVLKEKEALYVADQPTSPELQSPDTFDAEPRQLIRQAILKGDIDSALESTEDHFPGVLEACPHILFQLECRKFVELVFKAAKIDKSRDTLRKNKRHSNGTAYSSAVDDVFDQPMELDDEQAANGSGKAIQSEHDEYEDVTRDAIEYGQGLKEKYGDKGNTEHDKILHDIFSLMPYYDPSPSQNGHLLDASGRTKVAEDLNSAILSSLGRPSTAAIETIYRQTEALLETLSVDGGPASLVDLHREVSRSHS